MKKAVTQFWVLCGSVIVMAMAVVLIVMVHMAKFFREIGSQRE